MKPAKKIGIIEKFLNSCGYFRPVEKKTRKPRAKKAVPAAPARKTEPA